MPLGVLVVALAVASALGTAPLRGNAQEGDPVTLTVSAAADLTPAFEELGRRFEEATGVSVDFNFGSTGQLAEQIAAGAPVDVFAAANEDYVLDLADQGRILPDSVQPYARGRIVLWTLADSPLTLAGIEDVARPEVARVAIANPDHAPYGVAAREAMQSAGVWDGVQPKLVLGENIRDTLRYAETGNVDVAVVALSLAIQGEGQWVLIPEDLHDPIDQALGVVASTDHEAEARAFAEFVNGDEGREVMRRYGFVLPGEALATPAAAAATPVP